MRVPAALVRARADLPRPVEEVLRTLRAAGHRSWIVGGAVRDLLLRRPRGGDFDVATPATPEQVRALFRKVVPTGVEHGTVTVVLGGEPIEVTTFRGEGAYVDGRRPESVTFHTDLEADLARRDFTMNALAWDPLAPEFRDPFGGRADIARRVIRAVGDPAARFGEDGLRAMRAVRFAAQLGYGLHPRTRAAIPGALDVVRKVSVERVSDELAALVVAPHAERGLALMRRTGLLDVVLPAASALAPAALDHAAAVLRAVPDDPALRFAALLHGLGAAEAERVLVGLRQPGRVSGEVAALVRAHACRLSGPEPLPASPAEVRRWLSRVGPGRSEAQLALARAEAAASRGRAAREEVKALAAAVARAKAASPPLSAQELALDGRAVMAILGGGPGPHVGEALRHLLDRVLEDPSLNGPAALERELRAWWLARKAPL
ncbi:MAG TPA: tRNA cytidylyltransferase [Anaeromyxobacter sp.]|nr:tRNA cytidylyltransferase [Anaeromyxobacter sp.]